MAFDPLSIGLSLAGGLLGAGGNDQSATSEKKLDPRLERYVYGPDGESGLLGAMYQLAQEQASQGGLNDLQRQGLEMQRQYLNSPEYSQGMNQLRSMGLGLLGGGVAANPFTGGGVTKPATGGGFSYSGLTNAKLPEPSKAAAPKLTQPAPAPMQAPANLGLSSGGSPGTVNPYNASGAQNAASLLAWGPYAGGGNYDRYSTGSGYYSYPGYGDGNSGMGD
jgi:hypothetical protein